MTYRAHPETRVGHIHLKVSDLDRAITFYRDVLGFDLTRRYGDQAAFLSAGGYHHHIGLNTWESRGGTAPPRAATGLYHAAFLYPDRAALAAAVANLLQNGVELTGSADHGVSEAVYFKDPDGNGLEFCRDRAPEDWPRDENGDLAFTSAAFDVDALIAEAD